MIQFTNVTKVYDKNHNPALNDVTFKIERGEFIFLVGQSGSGKSTLLSLILRAQRANSGEILVAGKNLGNLSNWRVPEYRQQLGVVFQNFRLLQNKNVYENVAFVLQVINKPKNEIAKLVPEALKIVGLDDKADRMPWELSGGEQQRVAIARAFVNRPLIILADEPTGNLDPATGDEIMKVFEMISKMGTTILMATHSEDIVNRYRKRVIELELGSIVRDENDAIYGVSHQSNADAAKYEEVFGAQAEIIAPENIDGSIVQKAASTTSNETVRIAKMPRKSAKKTANQADGPDALQTAPTQIAPIPKIPLPPEATVRIAKMPRKSTVNVNTGEFNPFAQNESYEQDYATDELQNNSIIGGEQ